jgi:DNA repair protein RadC
MPIKIPKAGVNFMTLFEQEIAEIKISYSHIVKPSEQPKITCSSDAYNYMRDRWPDLDYRERFGVLLLSRSNRILGFCWISMGGTSGTIVDVKNIFQVALKTNSSSIIICHSHPSGNTDASDADIKITKKIVTAGHFLDITVLDHVILTSESYMSMADEGILPSANNS